MKLRMSYLAVLAVVVALVASAPAAAFGANAYGQVFAGQAECLKCHGDVEGLWQVSTYPQTAHGRFVTDVQVATSALVPAPTSNWWPSPAFGGGLAFRPSDTWLMIGAPGVLKEYVSIYRNDAPHTVAGTLVSPVPGPADDFWLFDPIAFDPVANTWELEGPVTVATYFQRCGGCHNLGITRATDTTYTLASGATVGHNTPTTYAGLGIQCEACHGTGSTRSNHHLTGVEIVRTKQVLKSQTCGQCHVSGTAKEKNYIGKTFSSPNGFTPDKNLEDFFNITGIGYIRVSAASQQPTIPPSETKFYPDGHNRSMNHVYYNEWMLSEHARSLRWRDGSLWSDHAKDSCLKCHSGEGFLKRNGYGTPDGNDIAVLPSSLASDTLNVECGVCHTVHATSGDALGLRLPEDELCQACHNAGIAEGAEATRGATIHHPQGEMLAGYGLIGVPRPAEEFMTNAECADCHMPETREGRISHRFTPMLPGNAKAWNVRAGGDSCTPCHASLSRDELQAKLDEWREVIAGATAEASAAIAAAAVRPAASSGGGTALLAAARTNVSFVTADESGGAHDYPYAKAGLEKAAYFADAVGGGFQTLAATTYDSRSGLAFVYGKLALGDGSVRPGERVTIEAQPYGQTTWTPVATVTTMESGDFSCAVGPKATTVYRARWTPLDDATVVVSAGAAVSVPGEARVGASTTTILLSSSSVPVGRSVVIRGRLLPVHARSSVTVQYRWGTGEWRNLATCRLDSASSYRVTFSSKSRGTCYFRTVFTGDSTHVGSVSPVVAVRVY